MGQILKLFQAIPLFVQYLILPLALMAVMLFYPYRSRLAWLLTAVLNALFLLVLHFSAVWEMSVGHYTRYLLEVLFLAACVCSYIKQKGKPFVIRPGLPGYAGYILQFALIIMLAFLNINNIRAFFYHEEVIHLQFPLRNGTYLINDGGDGAISSLVNYHYQDAQNIRLRYNTAERYANDIVKLDGLGFEGRHLGNEKELSDYYIYDETVYSPCDGKVTYVQDGNDDILPGETYKDTGNGVVVKTGDVYVMLWHLKKGSILVKAGDEVKAGDPLAKVGNSGISHAPHLHIHAAKGHFLHGVGVPVAYDSRNPIKNRIFRK